jgi:hypothetical protein
VLAHCVIAILLAEASPALPPIEQPAEALPPIEQPAEAPRAIARPAEAPQPMEPPAEALPPIEPPRTDPAARTSPAPRAEPGTPDAPPYVGEPPARPVATEGAASAEPRVAVEFPVTLMAGSYRGPSPASGAGLLDFGIQLAGRHLVGGMRFGVDTLGDALGVGAGVSAGARVPVGATVRAELLGELGVNYYEISDTDVIVASEDNAGSGATLPTAGLRLGLTWPIRSGAASLGVGAMVRWVRPETVTYSATGCVLLFFCETSTRTASFGGTVTGLYVTFAAVKPAHR